MSEKNGNEKRKLEEKIKDLEEKVRRLEEEKGQETEEEPESPTDSILEGLGSIMPGLDGLIKALGKSQVFQERLRAIDQEIEARLKEPLKRTAERGRRGGRAPILGKPPGARSPLAKRTAPPVSRKPPVTVEEPLADVFDEEDHLKVVAALPGIEEKDIKVDLSDAQLIISADTPGRKYRKEITLPSVPKGEVESIYRNGILQITLRKESATPD
ncbi:MAG: Hsp20/alpha crystallin family protein [Candidatus Zixiibacteriota bacterium]